MRQPIQDKLVHGLALTGLCLALAACGADPADDTSQSDDSSPPSSDFPNGSDTDGANDWVPSNPITPTQLVINSCEVKHPCVTQLPIWFSWSGTLQNDAMLRWASTADPEPDWSFWAFAQGGNAHSSVPVSEDYSDGSSLLKPGPYAIQVAGVPYFFDGKAPYNSNTPPWGILPDIGAICTHVDDGDPPAVCPAPEDAPEWFDPSTMRFVILEYAEPA